MTIQDYIKQKKDYYNYFLAFIDDQNDVKDKFRQMITYFENLQLMKKREEIKEMLYLLYKISKFHHRSPDFFIKIDQIILYFQDDIKQTFTNSEIFNFFQNNKRILLFLFENKIIVPTKLIIDSILKKSYSKDRTYRHFFIKEIKLFVDEKTVETIEKEISNYDQDFYENFDEKRHNGENETYICQLIRNDSVEEFVSYVNRSNYQISSQKISPSIFETNSFLIKKNVSLIEYAAFYGSIQIFQYLLLNNVQITPLLWLFVIHGRKPELIHILEENRINPPNQSYFICLVEAIKCHHNEIADYIIDNLLNENIDHLNSENNFSRSLLSACFRFYNYFYFPKEFNHKFVFNYLCNYDYFSLVKLLISSLKENIKSFVIQLNQLIDNTSLRLAARKNNFEIINFLLSQHKIEIEKNFFKGCQKLTQIKISTLTTIIGSNAFCDCSSLEMIEISSTIKSIGFSAFERCCLLKKVTLPPLLTTITNSLFNECSSLIEINVPSSVTSISNFAFSGCTSLKKIEIPSSVNSIGQNAFSRCSSLTELTIPFSVKSIESYTFHGCCSLVRISIPSSVISIGYYSFGFCSSLKEISIPLSVKSIDSFAFSGCSSLFQISLPSLITKIESNTFTGCSSLTKISVPSLVTSIGYSAFKGCSSLIEISIPKSVTKIGDAAFKGCSSLKYIIIPSSINTDDLGLNPNVKIEKVYI